MYPHYRREWSWEDREVLVRGRHVGLLLELPPCLSPRQSQSCPQTLKFLPGFF